MMLVEEKMQLVEGTTSYLPMVFFVHIAKSHGIRENLIEIFGAGCADSLIESNWQLGDFAVWLDFRGMLVLNRSSLFRACFELIVGGVAFVILGAHVYLSSGRYLLESQDLIILLSTAKDD